MWFSIAVLSSLLFGIAGLIMKVSQMKKGSLNHLLFGLYVTGTLGFLANSLWEGTLLLLDWRLWVGGIIIGMGSAWGNLIFMKALEIGPASLTAPLTNMNIVLIILLSTVFYHESIGGSELIGIVLLVAAVMLISIRKKEPLSVTEKKWFLLVAFALILFTFRNGGLKVTAAAGLENTPILFIGYLLSAIWFGLATLLDNKHVTIEAPLNAHSGLLWGLLAGLFSYAGLQLYSIALQLGKANVVAPIFGTNSLVIAIGSILLFNERLTTPQKFALMFLFSGLILVRV
jgi:uncharacterized membrane protein